MKTDDGSACRTYPRTKRAERLICSGRSARRTAYRCRFVCGRTYGGEEIDDDPAVCLECREPEWKCAGEYQCYLRHKELREKRHKTLREKRHKTLREKPHKELQEKPKKKEVSEMLLDEWKPSGIYDIWGENLP